MLECAKGKGGSADPAEVGRRQAASRDAAARILRCPVVGDAPAVSRLIASCPPLDTNSLYCTLLQCTDFSSTCILAERDGAIEGWISGYRPPNDPAAMFVWQVAVHESARGTGLGGAMLDALFALPAAADATRLVTTVTPTNGASLAMFAAFARRHGAGLEARPRFDRDRHFGGKHESEDMITIAPLPPQPSPDDRI